MLGMMFMNYRLLLPIPLALGLSCITILGSPSSMQEKHVDRPNGWPTVSGSAAEPNNSVPGPITDDDYLAALARFHAAVPRDIKPGDSYHRHTDLRVIDVQGRESSATIDHWQNGRRARDEESAPGWQYLVVWGTELNWSIREGISPMRLSTSLFDITPRPNPIERRIRIFGGSAVRLKSMKIDGLLLSCSPKIGGADICFDTSTGFPALADLDEERVVYTEWRAHGRLAYPSRWALYRGKRLQMEATANVTQLDASEPLFAPLPGVMPVPNRFGVQRDTPHRILVEGAISSPPYGQALIKVSVDGKGRVRQAELLDADDRSLGSAALAAARNTKYLPETDDGRGVPFEAAFRVNQWSTIDPLAVEATSIPSQGPD
jgi:TonB family protein